jgi:hypothetical protein
MSVHQLSALDTTMGLVVERFRVPVLVDHRVDYHLPRD